MNMIKGIAGLLIFLSLFIGGWALDQNMKRDHKAVKTAEETGETGGIEVKEVPPGDPFKPREYIRIRLRSE
jgi:hypothetical protein